MAPPWSRIAHDGSTTTGGSSPSTSNNDAASDAFVYELERSFGRANDFLNDPCNSQPNPFFRWNSEEEAADVHRHRAGACIRDFDRLFRDNGGDVPLSSS